MGRKLFNIYFSISLEVHGDLKKKKRQRGENMKGQERIAKINENKRH